MHSYITVVNESTCPIISVFIDGELFFRDVIYKSHKKPIKAGSIQVVITDNREKVMHDLYLGVNPKACYILKVHTGDCIFIQTGFS